MQKIMKLEDSWKSGDFVTRAWERDMGANNFRNAVGLTGLLSLCLPDQLK